MRYNLTCVYSHPSACLKCCQNTVVQDRELEAYSDAVLRWTICHSSSQELIHVMLSEIDVNIWTGTGNAHRPEEQ
jgi:hypothetical protein